MKVHLNIYGAKSFTVVNAISQLLIRRNSFIFSANSTRRLESKIVISNIGMPVLELDGEVCLMNGSIVPTTIILTLKNAARQIAEEVDLVFTKEDELYVGFSTLEKDRSNDWFYKLLSEHESSIYDWAWPTIKMFPLSMKDFKTVYNELKHPTKAHQIVDPFVIEKRNMLKDEFFRLIGFLKMNKFFICNWLLKPVVDKASFIGMAGPLSKDLSSIIIKKLESPEFQQFLNVIRELREHDWLDPLVLLRDMSYYTKG